MTVAVAPGKLCTRCGKPGQFGKCSAAPDGLQYWCKQCHKVSMAARYRKNKKVYLARCAAYRAAHPEQYKAYAETSIRENPESCMLKRAKLRAKKRGIPFNIDVSDISIPKRCPLLGIPLKRGVGSVGRNSPTIDRKDPTLGYVKGNVWVISHKANAMKQDATLAELELLVCNLRLELRSANGELS